MKELFTYFNYLRAIPTILAYYFISDKKCVNRDIERNLGNKNQFENRSNVYRLVWLLTNKKVFRNIYYYRIKQRNKVFGGGTQYILPTTI